MANVASSKTDPSGHRIPLVGGWQLWPWVCLRGAGFPATCVLPLAVADLDRHLADLATRRRAAEQLRRDALAACDAPAPDAGREELRALQKTRRKLRAGHLPDGAGLGPEAAAALDRLRRADEAHREAAARFAEHLAGERPRLGGALRDQARDGRFREALVWQNRRALRGGVDALLRQPPGAGNSQTRQNEELVARYLQRYAVKNDSVSFFGPIGWGTLAAEGPALEVRPGPALVGERSVYFEHWAIAALADELARRPALRPWLRPRRQPTVRVENTTLYLPDGRSVRLSAELAWLMAACDGERTARELAQAMLAEPALRIGGEEEVYQLLERLERRRLAVRTLEIPTEDAHPENALRRRLEAIGAPTLRDPALAELDELVERRQAVAQAAGEARALERAMSDLEMSFERLTGRQATRRSGETYAGRSLVYEDCRRDVELTVGGPLLAELAPALALLLTSARWYTHTLAARCRKTLGDVFAALREETASTSPDFLRFWQRAAVHLGEVDGRPPAVVREVVADFTARWSEVLGVTASERRLERASEALGAAVAAAFAAPEPGWPTARFHSLDLLIAACDPEAVRRGDFYAVLGELHAGVNGHLVPMFLLRHPHPDEILAARRHELPESSVAPILSRERFHRSQSYSLEAEDFHLATGADTSWRSGGRVIPVGELVVEERDQRLLVRRRDGSFRCDLIAFIERSLIGAGLHELRFGSGARHAPRVSVDRLVLCRESWRFEPRELAFALLATADERFREGALWARTLGLPRFVFVKTPKEPKAFYVDFHSPIYVEVLARAARRAGGGISVTEMLPAHGELWLADARRRVYSSELRLVAVDPIPWSVPGSWQNGEA